MKQHERNYKENIIENIKNKKLKDENERLSQISWYRFLFCINWSKEINGRKLDVF